LTKEFTSFLDESSVKAGSEHRLLADSKSIKKIKTLARITSMNKIFNYIIVKWKVPEDKKKHTK
jgi:hypothetical protein